jgi:hypothetical protein
MERRPATAPTEPQTLAGKLARLKPGDILRYSLLPEHSFTVTGFIDYQEEEYRWREVRLVDGDFVRWLEIEEEDFTLELMLWEEIDLAVPRVEAMPQELAHAGRSYRLKESGVAQATLVGQTGKRTQHTCRYWEYTADGGASSLAIEQWGGDLEVSLGTPVREAQIELFPAG